MLRIAALSNVGRCRNVNEDAASIVDLATGWSVSGSNVQTGLRSDAAVIGVYDGTGHIAPEQAASHVAARIVCQQMLEPPRPVAGHELAQRLGEAVRVAAREIVTDNERSRRGLGTTATLAAIAPGEVVVAHVGDSRAYLFRGGVLGQVSRDDTLLMIDLIDLDQGKMSAAEIEIFEHRNVVTRVLGYPHGEEPSITSLTPRAGDILLLCTDGISGMVDDAAIAALLRAQRDPEAICKALVEAAEQLGGPDNQTVAVASFDPENLAPEPPGR